MDFDTGSSDFFLPGVDCDSNCDGHTLYNPSSSSTASDKGQTFNLQFGDNSTVSGEWYTDTVTLAGYQVGYYHSEGILSGLNRSLSGY